MKRLGSAARAFAGRLDRAPEWTLLVTMACAHEAPEWTLLVTMACDHEAPERTLLVTMACDHERAAHRDR